MPIYKTAQRKLITEWDLIAMMCHPPWLLLIAQAINNRAVNIHYNPPYHDKKAMSG